MIELLRAQHGEMRSLLTEVKATEGEPKAQAFAELVRLLAVHGSAEEQVVHPAARKHAGDAVVDARLREEDDVKNLLHELYDMGLEAHRFETRFAALETALLNHCAQEEQIEFPALRAGSDPGRLRHLALAVRAAEAVAPKRPHPEAGTRPLINLLTGPPVALFDEVREALGRWRESSRS
ncbi:hemerythrin domain-containing protein [Actinoplanes sp. TRM 88003]|uniref:Hemerythrin domain-containing protein n=1 Tax=Paractinoplanes aksuensis TaxID=2939490 RepID=A0ABT1E3G2_9ACTN|nr:hemerythrin domain-containing protein [Actinoplanes aksuensis]MCO8277664.1 hemerythrin domain-containing protein [Actinoplanes aksuensis]